MPPIVSIRDAAIFAAPTLRTPILSDVNFDVNQGELVYIVGRVGSGKSSLLKTLYAEQPLRIGTGMVCGVSLRNLNRKSFHNLRRNVGVVFQEYNLLNGLNIYRNLEFVLRATEWNSKQQIHRRIEEVLNMVSMCDKAYKLPSQLSGGERQRICVARALLNSPQLIIADEPTGNLDPTSAANIIQLFHSITQSGCTVILSTHNSENLRLFPARVMRCSDGFIEDIL